MDINFLLCSPSPRDISQVYEALKKCPYDRLYAKYFPETQAYNLMRDFFLSHEEYTHLVICPDDLVVQPNNIERLYQEIEKNSYSVLAGVCNVDLGENKNKLNITRNLPHPTRTVPERGIVGWRHYDWIADHERYEEPVIPVPFSGFAAQSFSRAVMELIKFQDDSKFNGQPSTMTGAIDVMFANQCAFSKPPIKQYVDLRNRMKHLKLNTRFQDIQIGDGELRLYPKNKDMYEMIFKEPLGQKREFTMHKDDQIV